MTLYSWNYNTAVLVFNYMNNSLHAGGRKDKVKQLKKDLAKELAELSHIPISALTRNQVIQIKKKYQQLITQTKTSSLF